jgi:Zn-dependent protease
LGFALVTWTLAVGYFPSEFNTWPTAEYWIADGVIALMLFVSVLLHELGHSVLAKHYKIPVRSITLFIFGGIAQIGAEPPGPAAEFWIAIAGPVVSFGLAALFGLLQPVFTGVAPLLALAKYLAYINGALALFNLIPVMVNSHCIGMLSRENVIDFLRTRPVLGF